MVPLEGLRDVVGEAPDAGTERQGCSGYLGDNLMFFRSSVLFLRSAPELGSSTQLLLNCRCSDYYQVARERGRLHSGVRAPS